MPKSPITQYLPQANIRRYLLPGDQPLHHHDCSQCIYLGTTRGRDLYFCHGHGSPTVVSRSGPDGEYESGIESADQEPSLALALIRAIRLGYADIEITVSNIRHS